MRARGKLSLATGAVLALVVIGGVGGVTVRAFAGVVRGTIVTRNVTRFCVYVDRRHSGVSYGDVSVVPKYAHRVCIVGKRGAAGDTSVVTWNQTIATPGSLPTARRGTVGPNTINLATVGPFTVRGYCATGEGTVAYTDVFSAQDGSSMAWGGNHYSGNFNSGDSRPASTVASGSVQSPDFVNEYPDGDFSVSTGDQTTAFTGFANNGVYINGPEGPACSFTGYLVVDK
jgi:hypothetical protein